MFDDWWELSLINPGSSGDHKVRSNRVTHHPPVAYRALVPEVKPPSRVKPKRPEEQQNEDPVTLRFSGVTDRTLDRWQMPKGVITRPAWFYDNLVAGGLIRTDIGPFDG